MKTSLYFHYPTRALLRGGLRTILAVICIAVGVMAVVSLQLVSLMLKDSLTSNVRETNGGDIAVMASGAPLKTSDLAFFDQLKQGGRITNYSAVINANGALTAAASSIQSFTVEAVDPSNYPLLAQPTFVQPTSSNVAHLLTQNQVIVTQNFMNRYQKRLGDTFNVYIKTNNSSGQIVTVTLAGIIANTGTFAQANNLLLIGVRDYLAQAPAALASYSTIDVTTADQAQTDAVVKAITNKFPLIATQTATDALKSEQSSVDITSKFLEIAGLLALLIGGVGIINTMQVQLSRRKTEIAMLKTAGYGRRDLSLLFGLEAGMLGLVGGIIGTTAAIGVSSLVRDLMVNLGINVLFTLDLGVIASGVLIGCATALIFGLLPIIQAASVRPLQVIRETERKSKRSTALAILLLFVLSVLFCLLASAILNNDLLLGIEATYGIFAFLLILGAFFSLLIVSISKLPVPERLQFKQVGIVLVGVVISVLIYRILPVFGIFLLAISLLGIVITFLPRSWKVSTKMALRNIGRGRTRTMETMVALFIGIFGIGIVIGLGQDVKTQITTALALNSPYNIVATAPSQSTLQTQLHTLPGLTSSREDPFVAALPVAINGQPSLKVLPTGNGGQQAMNVLGQVEGYDLTQTLPMQTIIQGRNLKASDANTNNVIVCQMMTNRGWYGMNLKPGDTVTFASADGKTLKTVTIVGIISNNTSFEALGKVLTPAPIVNALNTEQSTSTSVFYMNVESAHLNAALDTLGRIAPDAAVQNLSDAGTSFMQQLGNLLDIMIAVASLSLIAAVIIIANAVALAMLERKRELGIIKAVGYTSGNVLSEVLIENGIVGGVGAFVAILLAAGGVTMAGKVLFNMTISMEPILIVSLIAGSTLLAMLTAALVAWRSAHVRPLTVLRYE